MKAEKRLVKPIPKEYETTIYVAEDGKEFNSAEECKRYEEEQEFERGLERIDKYRIEEMDGQIPLDDDARYSFSFYYRWYRVRNEKELKEIQDVYKEDMPPINKFPTAICMEMTDRIYQYADIYCTPLDHVKFITEEFFEKLGIKVSFEEVTV